MEINIFWMISSLVTIGVFALGIGYFWGSLHGYQEGLLDGRDLAVRGLVKAELLPGQYLSLTKEYNEGCN